MKTTYEFFQTGGYDETLSEATLKWESENPGQRVVSVDYVYANPGRPGGGRWVGLQINHEEK